MISVCHYKIRQIKQKLWLRPRDRRTAMNFSERFFYLKKTPWEVLFSKVVSYFPKMLTLTKKTNMFQNWYIKKKLVRNLHGATVRADWKSELQYIWPVKRQLSNLTLWKHTSYDWIMIVSISKTVLSKWQDLNRLFNDKYGPKTE